MIKAKYVNVTKSLDLKVFKRFGIYLNSKFNNSSKSLIRLYSLIKKNHSAFLYDQFDKTFVFKKIYPGKKYNEKVLNNLDSKMFIASQKFLKCLECRKMECSTSHKGIGTNKYRV